ncbi:MAG TPA: hypothetical protein PKE12_15385 [Kiritimatiellia bacterium]|nr:hypothetical protein [Kiritimatiellia bacterium]
MSRARRVLAVFLLLWAWDVAVFAAGTCNDVPMPGGATARYCVPERWNGHLVVFAHGTVAASEPLGFYHLDLEGVDLPDLLMKLGYAFATTTFRANGLNTLEAVEDLRLLVAGFPAATGKQQKRTVLAAVSLGASPAAIALEQYPNLFHGALLICGPIGSMKLQMDYLFTFRVLYDHYFPGVLPGSITNVPASVMADWYTIHEPAVIQAAIADPERTFELLRVAQVEHAPGDIDAAAQSFADLLWYHVFGLDDLLTRLGGLPFDNRTARYTGSTNDAALNAAVARVRGNSAAQRRLLTYENRAQPARPVVILHNTGDDIVPFGHAPFYQWRAQRNGRGKWVTLLPVRRPGHVNLTIAEAMAGFLITTDAAGAGLALPAR